MCKGCKGHLKASRKKFSCIPLDNPLHPLHNRNAANYPSKQHLKWNDMMTAPLQAPLRHPGLPCPPVRCVADPSAGLCLEIGDYKFDMAGVEQLRFFVSAFDVAAVAYRALDALAPTPSLAAGGTVA